MRADTATRGVEFFAVKRSMLGFPLGDSRKPVPDQESAPGSCRHSCRHAHAFGGGSDDYAGVDVRIDSDGELRRWVATRHPPNYATEVGPEGDYEPSGGDADIDIGPKWVGAILNLPWT